MGPPSLIPPTIYVQQVDGTTELGLQVITHPNFCVVEGLAAY